MKNLFLAVIGMPWAGTYYLVQAKDKEKAMEIIKQVVKPDKRSAIGIEGVVFAKPESVITIGHWGE